MTDPIDSGLTVSGHYEELKARIRSLLPEFLSAKARYGTADDSVLGLTRLLDLEEGDLYRWITFHLLHRREIDEFVKQLDAGLKNPDLDSHRPRVVSSDIRGAIDWGATIRHRTISPSGPQFVLRPPERVFDTDLNRALRWVVQYLSERTREVQKWTGSGNDPTHERYTTENSSRRMERQLNRLKRAQQHPILRKTRHELEPPSPRALRKISCSRRRFYSHDLLNALDAIHQARRLVSNPADATHELLEFLEERFFVPSEAWRMFEIVVALEIDKAIRDSNPAAVRTAYLIQGSRKHDQPFSSYEISGSGEVISLYYQCWPTGKEDGLIREVSRRYFPPNGVNTRPDLVVQRLDSSGTILDELIIEIKLSDDKSYLTDGLVQLLGYLSERAPDDDSKLGGWLIAPNDAIPAPSFPKPEHRISIVSDKTAPVALVSRIFPTD